MEQIDRRRVADGARALLELEQAPVPGAERRPSVPALEQLQAEPPPVVVERALEIGRRFGAVDLELLAQALQGLILVAQGDVETGMRRLDEATAAALAGEMGQLNAVGATCCLLVHACERVRDYDRAAQWAERVRRFSREWSIEPSLTVCRTQHAAMLIGRGEWAEAEQELQEACDARRKPGLLGEQSRGQNPAREQGKSETAERRPRRSTRRSAGAATRTRPNSPVPLW